MKIVYYLITYDFTSAKYVTICQMVLHFLCQNKGKKNVPQIKLTALCLSVFTFIVKPSHA